MMYLKLIAFSFLLAAGQILFKKAALKLNSEVVVTLSGILANYWLIAAVALYGSATLLWVIILRTVPLSLAYPFAALGFVIIPVAAFFIFNEKSNINYVIGHEYIIAGIILTQLKGTSG